MAINLVKGEIKIILETLTEQLNTINQHQGKIPQIELDIIMANIRKLYERFYDLNYLNNKPVVISPENLIIPEKKEKLMTEAVVDKKPEIPEPVIEVKQIIIEPVDNVLKKDLFEEKTEDQKEEKLPLVELAKTVVKESLFDEKTIDQEEVKSPLVEPAKKPKSEKSKSTDLFSSAEKETIADKFKETLKSVHEKFSAEKNDKTVAEKIGKSSTSNLKSAIGINDKFLFINQLFKGDLQGYNKAIEKLNSCTAIELATTALEELKAAYNWDNGDEAYQKLEDLVIKKLL
jgi:hypothetical protein